MRHEDRKAALASVDEPQVLRWLCAALGGATTSSFGRGLVAAECGICNWTRVAAAATPADYSAERKLTASEE